MQERERKGGFASIHHSFCIFTLSDSQSSEEPKNEDRSESKVVQGQASNKRQNHWYSLSCCSGGDVLQGIDY